MNSAAGTAGATHTAPHGKLSLGLVVLAAVLIGVGLLGTAYWLITFQWLLMLSLVALTLGGLLLFTRATGPDHA